MLETSKRNAQERGLGLGGSCGKFIGGLVYSLYFVSLFIIT